MKISDIELKKFLDTAQKEIPGFQIIYKDEEIPKVWYLTFIFFLINLVSIFSSNYKQTWMTRYSSSIGRFVIFPTRKSYYGDLKDYRTYTILRHELVHMIDQKNNLLLFLLTYILLPLPFIFSGRAFWEIRGYAQNLIVNKELGIKTSDKQIDFYCSQFTGYMYFYMFPFSKIIKNIFINIKRDIEDGKIAGYFPNISFNYLIVNMREKHV